MSDLRERVAILFSDFCGCPFSPKACSPDECPCGDAADAAIALVVDECAALFHDACEFKKMSSAHAIRETILALKEPKP